MKTPGEQVIESWFAQGGWEPFDFQREIWRRYLDGESGLVHSATGTGKTLAAWLGAVIEAIDNPKDGLNVLWITPLRALAADTTESLLRPIRELGLSLDVQLRTGDTTSAQRVKQAKNQPFALVTTPESLCLMLSQKDPEAIFGNLRCVVVDEWHELMSSKRGVQTELALARLRAYVPALRTWGVSATLGNLSAAAETLVGTGGTACIVKGFSGKEIIIDSVLPESMRRFPWAGHFGTQMIPGVIKAIEESESCLVFTNTRAMAEIWFQQILDEKPEWNGVLGLHHGSLDREVREAVEMGLKLGKLRAVVCTSSLDLGVDFSPVDRVIQVGSPKGVARLLQRAGRSGHRPGAASRVTCVPTHAFEMVDIAAARESAMAGKVEAREGVLRPLDVLAQHLVTIAVGPGFDAEQLYREVKTTRSFRDLTLSDWDWTLDFVVRGGESLRAYPEYRRVVRGEDGKYRVEDKDIAHRHRMSIGTIVSDAAMTVRYQGGSVLGTVEESFLSRLKPGDKFIFAGRPVQFLNIRDMTAYVKKVSSVQGAVPRWSGGRLPLSSELSQAIREELDHARNGELRSPEMEMLAPILELQARWSAVPAHDEFLIEQVESKEGHHLFFYPFEGRLVHEGLAALCAHRISQNQKVTFTIACNDYGFELLSVTPIDIEGEIEGGLFSGRNLGPDILESLNSVEMAKRQFREIARIAGLVFQGYPGMNKSARQLQVSTGLLFDVFTRFDPDNMLLQQAQREVLERQLEQSRLAIALKRLSESELVLMRPERPTPMSFPILVDRLRETVTNETTADRINRLVDELEIAAGNLA